MHRPIVIAGNREQFSDWCRRWGTNPMAVEYVETAAQLAAALTRTDDVRLFGDCPRNPAYRAFLTWQRSRLPRAS